MVRQIFLLTILAQLSPCWVLLFLYFLWTSNALDMHSDGLLELGRPSLFQATVHGAFWLLLSALHLGLLEHKVALLFTLTNQETKRTFYNYIFSYWFSQNMTYQYLNYWKRLLRCYFKNSINRFCSHWHTNVPVHLFLLPGSCLCTHLLGCMTYSSLSQIWHSQFQVFADDFEDLWWVVIYSFAKGDLSFVLPKNHFAGMCASWAPSLDHIHASAHLFYEVLGTEPRDSCVGQTLYQLSYSLILATPF